MEAVAWSGLTAMFVPVTVTVLVRVLVVQAPADDVPLVTWNVTDAPEARVKLVVSEPVGPQSPTWLPTAPLIRQSVPSGVVWLLIDQLAPAPPGSGSWTVTPVAAPGPALARVIVKPIVSPRLTGLLSAVFVRVRLGQLAVMEAVAWSGLTAMFVPVTVTVLVRVLVVQAPADDVPLVTWNVTDAPEARVKLVVSEPVGPQSTTWLPTAPLIRQSVPSGVVWLLIDQLAPAPPGSGSWTVTPVAAPGPALARVIVKPIVSPRLTGLLSAVFVRVRLGQLTSSEAEAGPLPSLVVVKLA